MKILVAGWDKRRGMEAVQTVVQRAPRRGHQVHRVLGDRGLPSWCGLSRLPVRPRQRPAAA